MSNVAIDTFYHKDTNVEVKALVHSLTTVENPLAAFNVDSKATPDMLAETLNTAEEATGAIIFIKHKTKGKILSITNNFYLTGLTFSYKERTQLLESFNSANVTFFGATAKVYQLQGVAIDYGSTDEEDPGKYFHQSGLIDMYENVLRGSKLVENDSIAVLKVLNHTIEGYPISMQVSYNSASDKMAQFTIAWVVTNHTLVLDGYLNSTRLKSFYDIDIIDNNTTKDTRDLISYIDQFFNLATRRLFIDPISNEAQFFQIFGTNNTEFILGNPKLLAMYKGTGAEKTAATDFLNLLQKYAIAIGKKIDDINKNTAIGLSIPNVMPHSLMKYSSPTGGTTFESIFTNAFVLSNDWFLDATDCIKMFSILRTNTIIYNISRKYTTHIPRTKLTKK